MKRDQDYADVRKMRASVFWSGLLPYLQLVASSGLAVFLFLFIVLGIHFYAELIDNIPEGLPVHWVAIVCMWPVLAFNSIRTYLQQADIVFLMPAEQRLSHYLSSGLRLSFVVQSTLTVFIWLVIWPLYRAGMAVDNMQLLLMLGLLLIMKWTSLYGRWQELQIVQSVHRHLIVMVRWLGTFFLLYVLFTARLSVSAIIIGICLLLYIAILQLLSQYELNWTHLITIERLHASRYYMVLSWFVNTPQYMSKIRTRHLINRLVEVLPFEQKYAFHYLYFKTLFRTSLYSLVIRLTLIGGLLIGFVDNEMVKSTLFIFFLYLIGVQLSALAQQHRYSFWLQVYPLSFAVRYKAVATVIRTIHLAVVIILYIVLAMTLNEWPYAVFSLLVAIIFYYIYHRRFKQRFVEIQD